VAGRGPDVDADGTQAQPFSGDVAGVVLVVLVRVAVRVRQG
jgi:hypothetical protein